MARPADEALIGRTIAGKFVIESFIGGGAMGAVYKAKQLSLDKAVAIKVLHAYLSDPSFTARFQREAKAASKLDHPNSMRVLDYGKDSDGLCYIAMEFLDGHGLFRILKDAHGPLPEARTVDLTRQILAALAAAHDMGVVHRDLKPENIIVVESRGDEGNVIETVKVCDFGMAKLMHNELSGDTSVEKLTSRGIVVGTPEYMSPEQGKGEELDGRSDLYSVGVILYQMLTGKLPFEADTPIAILIKHMVEAPRAPSAVWPEVRPELEAICLRVMSKAKEDRFSSAREMRAALRAALDTSGPLLAEADGTSGQHLAEDETPLSLPTSSIKQPAARPAFYSTPDDYPMPQDDAIAASLPRQRAVDLLEPSAPKRRAPYGLLVGVAAALVGAGVVVSLRSSTPAPVIVEPAPQPIPIAAPPPPATVELAPAPSVAPAPSGSPPAASDGKPVASPIVKPGKPVDNALPAATSATSARAVPSAAPPPSATVPANPPAPSPPEAVVAPAPTPFDKAAVLFGEVRAAEARPAAVVAAMPSGRFLACYREGLRAKGTLHGAGTLRLVFGSNGHVTETAFAGPPDLASVGQCVAGAAVGSNVAGVASGASGAEVDLSFKPD
jgi:serine/threonine protein kinase